MEHKVIIVVGKNGSIEVLNEEAEVDPWAELLTLGVLLVCSTVLNLIVIGGSLLGKARGTLDLAPLIVSLLVSNTLDAVINQTIALVFLAAWPSSSPPGALCQLSSMSYLAALLLQPLYILMHFLHVIYVDKGTSQVLLRFFHTLPPIMAFMLSSPIIFLPNAIPVHQIINRHVCGIAAENLVYSTSVVIFGFFSSWAAIVFCVVIRRFRCGPAHRCCGGDRDLCYAMATVGVAVVLVLPAVASFGSVGMTSPNHLLTYKDSEGLVVITGGYDTALTWAKFSFDLVSPLSVLLFYKDVRRECFHTVTSSFKSLVHCGSGASSRQSKERRSQGGPILFVTPNGLMLMSNCEHGRSPIIDTCDLTEQDQTSSNALALSNPRPPSVSPAPIEMPQKPEKTGKRKIVRFAQSVMEIPIMP